MEYFAEVGCLKRRCRRYLLVGICRAAEIIIEAEYFDAYELFKQTYVQSSQQRVDINACNYRSVRKYGSHQCNDCRIAFSIKMSSESSAN